MRRPHPSRSRGRRVAGPRRPSRRGRPGRARSPGRGAAPRPVRARRDDRRRRTTAPGRHNQLYREGRSGRGDGPPPGRVGDRRPSPVSRSRGGALPAVAAGPARGPSRRGRRREASRPVRATEADPSGGATARGPSSSVEPADSTPILRVHWRRDPATAGRSPTSGRPTRRRRRGGAASGGRRRSLRRVAAGSSPTLVSVRGGGPVAPSAAGDAREIEGPGPGPAGPRRDGRGTDAGGGGVVASGTGVGSRSSCRSLITAATATGT